MRLFSRPGAPVPAFEFHLGPQYPVDQALAARMVRVAQLLPVRTEPYGAGVTLRFYGTGESLQQRLLRPMVGREACALLEHMSALLRALVREQLPIKNLSFQTQCVLLDAQQGAWRFAYFPVSGCTANLAVAECFFRGIGEALMPADEDAAAVKSSYLAFFKQRERFDIMAFPTHLEQVMASVSCRPFKMDGRQPAQGAVRTMRDDGPKPSPVAGDTIVLGAERHAGCMQAVGAQVGPAQRVSPAAGLSRELHGGPTEVFASASGAFENPSVVSKPPTVVVADVGVNHIPGVADVPRNRETTAKVIDDSSVQTADKQVPPVSQAPIGTEVPKPKRKDDISQSKQGTCLPTEVIVGEGRRIDAVPGAQPAPTVGLGQVPVRGVAVPPADASDGEPIEPAPKDERQAPLCEEAGRAPVSGGVPAGDELDPTLAGDGLESAPTGEGLEPAPEGEPGRKRAPRRRYFLTRLSTKERFEVRGRRFVVGKSKYSSYQVRNTTTVSRSHALFFCSDEGCSMEDDHSRNGTYLNGERIYPGKRYALEDDDRIRMSDETFVFEVLEASEEESGK